MTNSSQQYSRKVSLLSQQTGKKNGKKVQRRQNSLHERIAKSTSLGRRPKSSSMNKHKKKSWKKYTRSRTLNYGTKIIRQNRSEYAN